MDDNTNQYETIGDLTKRIIKALSQDEEICYYSDSPNFLSPHRVCDFIERTCRHNQELRDMRAACWQAVATYSPFEREGQRIIARMISNYQLRAAEHCAEILVERRARDGDLLGFRSRA